MRFTDNYASDVELFGPDPIAVVEPFASAALNLRARGWLPLPLPAGKKHPPPDDYTGYRAEAVTPAVVERWIATSGSGNVAVRMPAGVIGIDVDDYGDKHGAIDLTRLEELHGQVPPTWTSTSRDGASGIRFYKVPVGTRFPGGLSTAIEVIQPHHRYAVVAPSIHPEGRTYRWYDAGGELSDDPPDVDDLAELPWPWIEALSDKRPPGMVADPANTEEVNTFVAANIQRTKPSALKGITTSLDRRKKGRHDTLVDIACQVAREAAAGWYTAAEGFDLLQVWWNRVMDNQRRLDGTEFANAIAWAIGQAQTEPDRIAQMRTRVRPQDPPSNVDPETGEVSWTNLPEEFWASRPVLGQIRQAAHSRSIAADSVFACVLARVAILTPPTLQLPPVVASTATMDLITALVAESGGGKTASTALAAEVVPINDDAVVLDFPVGSGEGVVDAYLGQVEELDLNGKKIKVRRQVKRAVLAVIDEGQVLAEFASRKGSTLMPTLRAAWSGSVLGQGNASVETNRRLNAYAYRFAAIISVQPAHAVTILADAPGGTPQRILWASAEDPSIPDVAPPWPGPLEFTPPTNYILSTTIAVADNIAAEIRVRKLARSRGTAKGLDPLDSHADLIRLKVAALLAILDHRLDINDDDWRLADTVMRTSHAVRTLVAEHAVQAERHREEAANNRAARREVALVGSVEARALDKAAGAIGRRAHRTTGEVMTRADLTRSVASRDRTLITIDDAISEAQRRGWIEQADDSTFKAGREKP